MSTLAIDIKVVRAVNVSVDVDTLVVDLEDGRTISIPLVWYLRLVHGTEQERQNWRLIGKGEGIHWLDLDEDISVKNLLSGKSSGESQRSFKEWLNARLEQSGKS